MTTTEPCGICGRMVAVADWREGAPADRRRGPEGKIRCLRHIGVTKMKAAPDSIKGLFGVVALPDSQVRFSDE